MDFSQWATPAESAIFLNLERNGHRLFKESFHPYQAHFLFEESQDQIIGYKNPKVNVTFQADDMRPTVRISYAQKIQPSVPGVAKLMDLKGLLDPYFAPDAFEANAGSEVKDGTKEETPFTPPGEKVRAYKNQGKVYEVWGSKLSDRRAIQILKNMKILIPMFIEGGTVTFLDDDDVPENRWTIDRWKIYFLYEVDQGHHVLAGFCTSYRLYVFRPDVIEAQRKTTTHTEGEFEEPVRERIAQFLILPPWQHNVHGIELYNTVTNVFLADPKVFEITVEDPNEHFDNLRDYCDLNRLMSDQDFTSLEPISSLPSEKPGKPAPELLPSSKVPHLLPKHVIDTLCKRHKMIPRQVYRLAEMHILHQIPPSFRFRNRTLVRKYKSPHAQDRAYYFWRLMVKLRVYQRNYFELQQVEEDERVGKIETSVDSLQEGYEELMDGYNKRVESGSFDDRTVGDSEVANGFDAVISSGGHRVARKRKVLDDDDDDDEDEDVAMRNGSAPPAKRQATEPLE